MNPNLHSSPEHEFEAQLGLPEKLPKGESILWQGAPDFKAVALRVCFPVSTMATRLPA
jgi:hypothetical protein